MKEQKKPQAEQAEPRKWKHPFLLMTDAPLEAGKTYQITIVADKRGKIEG